MSALKIVTIASALLIAASSFAMAQGPRMARGNMSAKAHSAVRTGTAMNRHKIRRGYFPRTR